MTSGTRAAHLVWYAQEILREMRESLERGVWNGVVRRGQESLELSCKAIIVHFGIEHPKTHDVGPALVAALGARSVSIDKARIDRIVEASSVLARLRAPALYAEMICSEGDARTAALAAEEAFQLASELVGEPPSGPFRPAS